jgi:hypothetical protein
VVAAALLIFVLLTVRWEWSSAWNRWRDDKNALEVCVDNAGIFEINGYGVGLFVPWTIVDKFVERKRVFVLQITGKRRRILKRGFSDADIDRLRAYVRTKKGEPNG